MSMDTLSQIEEERRLLYVAITRAKDTCTITYAGSRFRNGQTMMTRPSRFISEIEPRYLKMASSVEFDDGDSTPDFINPVRNYRSSYGGDSYSGAGKYGSGRYGTSGNGYDRRTVSAGGSRSTTSQPLPPGQHRVASLTNSGSSIKPQHQASELKVGMKIEHQKFGIGNITNIGAISGEASITVDFKNVGIKKLLLKFAKFNILND